MRQPRIEIPIERVHQRVRADNPWWDQPESTAVPFAALRPRPYLDLLRPLIVTPEIRRAVVLLGPRRVGKTVLLHHVVRDLIEGGTAPGSILFVSVDHPLYNGVDLERFVEIFGELSGVDPTRDEVYLFFDEIQYLRQWEVHLKALVDRFPKARCVVSGSAAVALRLKSRESGAGRFTDFLLPPLTFFEFVRLLGRESLFDDRFAEPDGIRRHVRPEINELFLDYLNFGGYPEIALSESLRSDPHRFVKSDIIDKVLLRDLPSLYGIQDIQELNALFTTLAYNTAGEVTLEKLSQNSGVSKTTIRKYVEYLEAAFLFRQVRRVDESARQFKRASRFKVYLCNPSMHAALFSPSRDGDESFARLVETAIFAQYFHLERPIYYASLKRSEVDLVLMPDGRKISELIEVKWSDRIVDHPEELAQAREFAARHDGGPLVCTTRSTWTSVGAGPLRCHFYPAALLAYEIGERILEGRRRDLQTGAWS